uniref:Uncharacterized protein n=1 Tax=Anguilla anguilla TaxID=7936 RepID=A0A0E9PIA1_ANGAN
MLIQDAVIVINCQLASFYTVGCITEDRPHTPHRPMSCSKCTVLLSVLP